MAFGFADFAGQSGVPLAAIDVPAGASVIQGSITITEIFNSATTDQIQLAGAGITVGGADNGSTLGSDASLTLDSTAMAVLTTLTLEWTGVGAVPTTGAGFALVEYIMDGKANEVVPA